MPFHVFLSQSLSLLTGGLEEWKIAKDLLLLALVLFTICLVFWQGKATRTFKTLLGLATVYGLLHIGLWETHPDLYKRAAELGIIYNMRLPLFAVLGLGAYLAYPVKFAFSSVTTLLLVISTIVAGLGLLQYFLPNDILTHVGYSINRGVLPSFSIDSNPLFPRIMSTLREPNALGAYLILPTTVLSLLLFAARDRSKRLLLGGALLLHLLAIGLTQSRSAWLGTALALAIAFLWQHQTWFMALLRRFWYVGAAVVLVVVVGTISIRGTHFFQAYVIHTSTAHTSDLDSNELHWKFAKQGLEGIARQPQGHGPGSAGLASIQNPRGSFLTENYYIQIGYEVGVLGLATFVAMNAYLYRLIWKCRDLWAVVLLSSFWAYVLTNMLLHTWSNEAVAAQWWITAGLAVAVSPAAKDTYKEAPAAKRQRR